LFHEPVLIRSNENRPDLFGVLAYLGPGLPSDGAQVPRLRPPNIPSAQSRDWKALGSARDCLVTSRTKLINHTRGWLRTKVTQVRPGDIRSFSKRVEVSESDERPRGRACDGTQICRHHRRDQSLSRSPCVAVLPRPHAGRELELDARAENFHHQGGLSGNALAAGAGGLVRLVDSTRRPNGPVGEASCSTSRNPKSG
jgi:hypothetical protein